MIELPERLLRKIEPVTESGCWIWTAAEQGTGYGRASFNGKDALAHRLVYSLLMGGIPEGAVLDHLCRVRCCVNPSHLEPVTMRINVLRGQTIAASNANKTHCIRGHELLASTVRRLSSGTRLCKKCESIRDRESYVRHRHNILLQKQEYYQRNKDAMRLKNEAYHKADRDTLLAKMRERYRRNK